MQYVRLPYAGSESAHPGLPNQFRVQNVRRGRARALLELKVAKVTAPRRNGEMYRNYANQYNYVFMGPTVQG